MSVLDVVWIRVSSQQQVVADYMIGEQSYPLKGLFTNFEYITFFLCPNKRNISYKRSISIKQLWLEIIEKIGCSKSVRPSTIIYIIYRTRTDFEHHFFQLFRVRVVLSKWTENVSFVGVRKKCYIFKIVEQSL